MKGTPSESRDEGPFLGTISEQMGNICESPEGGRGSRCNEQGSFLVSSSDNAESGLISDVEREIRIILA